MTEQYYVVRADRAGVFFGKVKENKGSSIIMEDVRKIYYWSNACAVEQISQNGVGKDSKITVVVSEQEIANPIQIIPCTEQATTNLKTFPAWKQ